MIYIIITTSILNKVDIQNHAHRQNRYIESIQQLLKLINNDVNIKPIIVENNGLRQTYLDNLNCDICYTNNNKISRSLKESQLQTVANVSQLEVKLF